MVAHPLNADERESVLDPDRDAQPQSQETPHQEAPPRRDVEALVERLHSTLGAAESLLRELEGPEDEEQAAVARGLSRRLEAAQQDRSELALRLVETERRSERLMTLYVATYHLHASQDPDAVESAIAEIAVDLLGARRFALLLRDGDRYRLTLSRPEGVPGGELDPMFEGGYYQGGDPLVDAALDDGTLRLAGEKGGGSRFAGTRALAAVPLNVEQETSGLLVILDLFEQKHSLTIEDRDLLDLLAAHAASALLAAELFRVKERKLRSYQSLLALARGAE